MAANKTLDTAKKAKQDEFYTQLSDIEAELRHYKKHFKDKIVFCNCDDPYESNFFKYFAMNFNFLGLKELIATCYKESPIAGRLLPLFEVNSFDEPILENKLPHLIRIKEVKDENGDGSIDLADVEFLIKNKKNILTLLEGDGDFRSRECVSLLKEADIVVTNPPFSLFRDYVDQLIQYNKKFIIIGSKNAITYKEIFMLIQDNKIWLGNGFPNGNAYFMIPEKNARDFAKGVYDPNTKLVKFRNVGWFTNLDIKKRHEKMTLYKHYNKKEYPIYDNYDAIEVSKCADIPQNYDGLMCVPITFLDKYNPDYFEILGITDRQNSSGLRTKKYTIHDSEKYNDLNARGVIKINGELKTMYARIIIRHKAQKK
jgi:hypothetical protein